MKSFKLKVAIYSFIIFIACIAAYYFIYVLIQKQPSEFCDSHYCLSLLEIGDFISILVAIIGFGVVVLSLDLWKHNQKYLETKDLLLSTKSLMIELKSLILINYKSLNINPSLKHNIDFHVKIAYINDNFERLRLENTNLNLLLKEFQNCLNNYTKSPNQENKQILKDSANALYDEVELNQDIIEGQLKDITL